MFSSMWYLRPQFPLSLKLEIKGVTAVYWVLPFQMQDGQDKRYHGPHDMTSGSYSAKDCKNDFTNFQEIEFN